jgi:hypothetical protein
MILPKEHTVSRSVIVRRDPRSVYDLVRDFEHASDWRSGVVRVEMLGATKFREHGKHGAVTYDIVTEEPGRQLVTRIADTNLGYGGSWTYTFEAVPEGTRVTITENGEVTNLLFRILSRFVFGHASTIEKTLAALERRLA